MLSFLISLPRTLLHHWMRIYNKFLSWNYQSYGYLFIFCMIFTGKVILWKRYDVEDFVKKTCIQLRGCRFALRPQIRDIFRVVVSIKLLMPVNYSELLKFELLHRRIKFRKKKGTWTNRSIKSHFHISYFVLITAFSFSKHCINLMLYTKL